MQTEAQDKRNPSKSHDASGEVPTGGKKQRRRGNKKVTTEESMTGGVGSTAASKPKTKRNRRNRPAKKSSDISTLDLPQSKLVIRSVGDIDKYGSYDKMISLIRDLVEMVNNSMIPGVSGSNNADDLYSIPLVIDEDSVQKVVLTDTREEPLAGKDEMIGRVDGEDTQQSSSTEMKIQSTDTDILKSPTDKSFIGVRILVSAMDIPFSLSMWTHFSLTFPSWFSLVCNPAAQVSTERRNPWACIYFASASNASPYTCKSK